MTQVPGDRADRLEEGETPDGTTADEAPEAAPADGEPESRSTGETEEPTTADETTGDVAERVVVSYPADLSEWGRFQVEKPSFRAFLRKTRDEARDGDVWEEFVGVGCCGNTLDVPLRVERVDGGARIGEETAISYEVREACGVQGSWRVQSQGGPNRS